MYRSITEKRGRWIYPPLLNYPAYAELKDEKEFERYGVDGMVFWANGADIAPEFLYENGAPVS